MLLAVTLAFVAIPLSGETVEKPAADALPSIRFIRSIGEYEKGRPLRDPMSIDLGASRKGVEILVADKGNNSIAVFSESGTLRMEVGGRASIKAPIGAAFDRDGAVLVAEMDSPRLKVIDLKGEMAGTIDLTGLGRDEGDTVNPGRLRVDADGNVYVLDRAHDDVIVMDRHRHLVLRYGGRDGDDGLLKMAQDLSLCPRGELLVSCAKGMAVHRYDAHGKFLSGFGTHGTAREDFAFPSGVAQDAKGRVWVADSAQDVLKVFDREGKLLTSLGAPGDGNGQFDFPVDMAFDANGRLYVLEKGASRVQVFDVVEGGK